VFKSWYRASDEYEIPVTSLVICTGDAKPVNTYASEWQGTSVSFRYNVYGVSETDAGELMRDGRNFALAALAARRMLEAGSSPAKRGKYSLELLDAIKERGLSELKAWSFQNFTSRILRIDEDDIDASVREVWKMRFRPMDEVVREIHTRYAKEEGKIEGKAEGKKEGKAEKAFDVARSMLADGFSSETVKKYTGLDETSILSLSPK
jgi:hypothetical protein